MTHRAREVIAASEAASSRLRTGSGVRARPSSAPFLKGSSRLSPADQEHISDLEAQIADLQTAVEVQYAAACQKQRTKSVNDHGHPAQERRATVAVQDFRQYLCSCAVSLAIQLHGCIWDQLGSQSVTTGLPLCTVIAWGGCRCCCCC